MKEVETIHGVFFELPFENLMGFLESISASGALEIRLPSLDLIRLYLAKGKIIGSDILTRNHGRFNLPRSATPNRREDLPSVRTRECIFRLSREEKTTFSFFHGAHCPNDLKHEPLNVPEALLNAAFETDEWGKLPIELREDETRFSILVANSSISLTLEQWEVLHLAKDGGNLATIWKRSRLSKFGTSRILHGLASAQVLRPITRKDKQIKDMITLNKATSSPASTPTSSAEAGLLTGTFNFGEISLEMELMKRIKEGEILRSVPTLTSRATLKELGVELPRLIQLGEITKIGRLPDNDFALEHAGVSRRHAEIRRLENIYILEDLNSTNGVWIDGKQVYLEYLTKTCEIMIPPQRFLFDIIFELAAPAGGDKSELAVEVDD